MNPKTTSPTDVWDLLGAFTNPVPSDVASAVEALGIDIARILSKPDSTELLSRCPSHQDRKPSFSVNSESGLFNCFACGYSGNFIQLVEDVLGVSQLDAFTWITRRGVYRLYETDDTTRPVSGEDEPQITEAHLALYVPPPREALRARRVSAASCAKYGVLWDPAKGHWIIPVREAGTGRLLGWQEKGEKTRYFRNYPARLPKSRCVFGLETLAGVETGILLESPLDCVRLDALDQRGGISGFGAYVSEYQMRLIRRRVKRLILGHDNDTAGIGARDKLYARWQPRGLPMRFLTYSGITAKDIGDMTNEQALWSVRNAHYPWQRIPEAA